MDQAKIDQMARRVDNLRQEALALLEQAQDFPALERNAARVLACVSMMQAGLGRSVVANRPRPGA